MPFYYRKSESLHNYLIVPLLTSTSILIRVIGVELYRGETFELRTQMLLPIPGAFSLQKQILDVDHMRG